MYRTGTVTLTHALTQFNRPFPECAPISTGNRGGVRPVLAVGRGRQVWKTELGASGGRRPRRVRRPPWEVGFLGEVALGSCSLGTETASC